MQKNRVIHWHSLIFVMLTIFLSACNNAEPSPTNIPTEYIDAKATKTVSPLVQPTSSHFPSTSTFTPIPIPTSSTPTPLPTLSLLDAQKKVNNLFAANEECKLPCWWGIMPGESRLSNEVHRLSEFMNLMAEDISNENQYGGAQFSYLDKGPFPGVFGSVYMLSKNDVVGALVVDGYQLLAQHYAIQEVLRNYGIPDNIWLYTIKNSYGEGELPFVITLDYSSRGVIVYYKGNGISKNQTGLIQLCYNKDAIPPKLILWDPRNKNPLAEPDSDYIFSIWSKMKTVETATGMSKDKFSLQFTEQKGTQSYCVETQASMWDD